MKITITRATNIDTIHTWIASLSQSCQTIKRLLYIHIIILESNGTVNSLYIAKLNKDSVKEMRQILS